MTDINHQVRMERRDERRLVAPYRGGIAWRLLATFAAFTVAWATILVAGFVGAVPLWLGGILSFVVATTFYMPMHEAAHGNVWGDTMKGRWVEDLVGMLSAIPVGFSFKGHRISHMRHHAFTNDPLKDPDFFAQGPLRDHCCRCLPLCPQPRCCCPARSGRIRPNGFRRTSATRSVTG